MNDRPSKPLTRTAFHALLPKAAQPIPQEEPPPVEASSETSAERPPDGYTETHMSPDSQEGSEA